MALSQAACAEVSLETFRSQITIKYDFQIPQVRGIDIRVAEKINGPFDFRVGRC
jgi:hypothetical protein